MARLNTIRLIHAIAAQHGWEVHYLEVKLVFLNGDLQEEVYVAHTVIIKIEEHKVYKLLKALYSLRQASMA